MDVRFSTPLEWPARFAREQHPRRSAFSTSFARARDGLIRELSKLGAEDVVISTNLAIGVHGYVLSRQPPIDDAGVAVYFTLDGEDRCIPCDRWWTPAENLHAIELTVSALRGLDRWGTHQVVEAAFSGFAALPAGGGMPAVGVIVTPPPAEPWWLVLGITQEDAGNREHVHTAYRRWARVHHPDVGGDPALFREITEAYHQALREVRA